MFEVMVEGIECVWCMGICVIGLCDVYYFGCIGYWVE